MSNKIKEFRDLIFIIVAGIICVLPTLVTLFYKKRHFVDLGLLLTAILFVIFIIPIYQARKRIIESKK